MEIKKTKKQFKDLPNDIIIYIMAGFLTNNEAWTLGNVSKCFKAAFNQALHLLFERMLKDKRKDVFRMMFRSQHNVIRNYEESIQLKINSLDIKKLIDDASKNNKRSIKITIPNNKVAKLVIKRYLEKYGIRELKSNDSLIYYITSKRHSNECIARHSNCICGNGLFTFEIILINLQTTFFEYKLE